MSPKKKIPVINETAIYDTEAAASALGIMPRSVTWAIRKGHLAGTAQSGSRSSKVTGRALLCWVDAGMPGANADERVEKGAADAEG